MSGHDVRSLVAIEISLQIEMKTSEAHASEVWF